MPRLFSQLRHGLPFLLAAMLLTLLPNPTSGQFYVPGEGEQESAERTTAPPSEAYRLREGDVVTVRVYEMLPAQEGDVTRTVTPTGELSLPVIGRVKAEGLTTDEVERVVQTRLDQMDIIKDARVSVVVEDRPGQTFAVLAPPRGEDQGGTRSGLYDLPKPHLRLIEALAMAGGVEPGVQRVRILRPVEGVEGGEGEAKGDVEIEAGDVIVTPEAKEGRGQKAEADERAADRRGIGGERRASTGFVYLMGNVARPGAYAIPETGGLTLKQLVNSAGGEVMLGGSGTTVRLLRGGEGQEEEEVMWVSTLAELNSEDAPPVMLRPKDRVEITRSTRKEKKRGLGAQREDDELIDAADM